jgi:cell division septation protein DedD
VENSRGKQDEDPDIPSAAYGSESEPELFEDEEDEYPAEEYADDDWDEQEAYSDEPDPFEARSEGDDSNSWPLGLIIVGLVALVLLAAGGYGVIQQRSAAQQEIRQLQATLATAASPAEVAASREALREMEQRAAENQATIDALTLENRRLSDTVAGLEEQLTAQRAAVSRPAESRPAAAAKPAAAPAATKPAATPSGAVGGDWFVNFSSYSERSIAESWVKKLKPSAGKALVVPGSKDGKTFYRVRVTGLADRAQAEKVAGQLQSAHNLPPLWVGRE